MGGWTGNPDTVGLVAYYPFTGNAADSSGNGNDGTVNGATLTTDRFGNADGAYSFNGTSDYIQAPHNNALNFGTGDFTVSGWVNYSSKTGQQKIFNKGNCIGPRSGWTLTSWPSIPLMTYQYLVMGTWAPYLNANVSTVNTATWYHILFKRSSGTVSIYWNNTEITSVLTASEDLDNIYPLIIGMNLNSS